MRSVSFVLTCALAACATSDSNNNTARDATTTPQPPPAVTPPPPPPRDPIELAQEAWLEAHNADVMRLLAPIPERLTKRLEHDRRPAAPGHVVLRTRVWLLLPGYACPPGAGNPYWRRAAGAARGVEVTRDYTVDASGAITASSGGDLTRVPRPMCPPVP
jgi:hypothetical protein